MTHRNPVLVRGRFSPEARRFFKEYYQWATNGAKQDKPFDRRTGLCNNVLNYWNPTSDVSRISRSERPSPLGEEIWLEIGNFFTEIAFRNPQADDIYPFGAAEYSRRTRESSQHIQEERLEFCRLNMDPD